MTGLLWILGLSFCIVVLVLLLVYFVNKYFYLISQNERLYKEINNQTLDYYLKKIKDLGYDVTIKFPKSSSGKRKSSKSRKDNSNTMDVKKGNNYFESLISNDKKNSNNK